MTTGSPYLDYFGFREDPFSLTPNPEYFYLTKEHELAFEELERGVSERKGIIMMIGEMGTGKTILLRTLKNKLPDNVLVSYQLNPSLGFTPIVKKMLKDFGLPFDSDSRAELISICHEKLSALGDTGTYGLLLLDEAQALNEEVLEDIRILSNIEDERGKFLNVILAGQPELADIISVSSLRSLKHRIGVRIYLKPMDTEEIFLYVNHRLEVAGWSPGEQLFTKDAMTWMSYSSNGNPRLINVIADNALHRAYRERVRSVDKEMLKRTLAALEGREPLGKVKPKRFSLKTMNPITAAILLFILVVVLLLPGRVSNWMERKAAKKAKTTAVQDTTAVPSATEESPGEMNVTPDTVTQVPQVSEKIESTKLEPVEQASKSDEGAGAQETVIGGENPVEAVSTPGESLRVTEEQGKVEQAEIEQTEIEQTEIEKGEIEQAEITQAESPVDTTTAAPVSARAEPVQKDKKDEEGWWVVVKKGEWIYLIIEREYGYASWAMVDTVVKLNERVKNPNRVYPGQKLYLPPRSMFE